MLPKPRKLLSQTLNDPDFKDIEYVLIVGVKKNNEKYVKTSSDDLLFLATSKVIIEDVVNSILRKKVGDTEF